MEVAESGKWRGWEDKECQESCPVDHLEEKGNRKPRSKKLWLYHQNLEQLTCPRYHFSQCENSEWEFLEGKCFFFPLGQTLGLLSSHSSFSSFGSHRIYRPEMRPTSRDKAKDRRSIILRSWNLNLGVLPWPAWKEISFSPWTLMKIKYLWKEGLPLPSYSQGSSNLEQGYPEGKSNEDSWS